MKYYALDENNNKVEVYSKEEVLAVLQQAINEGTLENIVKDAGFVSKLKCCVNGVTNYIAFVTQAKYNELAAAGQLVSNCYYHIVDDTTGDDINAEIESIKEELNSINGRLNSLYLSVGAFDVSGIDASLVTTNEIRKQGKYIIANLSIILVNQDYSNLEISLPRELAPNSTHTLMIAFTNSYGIPTYKEVQVQENIDLTEIKAISGLLGLTIVNAGWEV